MRESHTDEVGPQGAEALVCKRDDTDWEVHIWQVGPVQNSKETILDDNFDLVSAPRDQALRR